MRHCQEKRKLKLETTYIAIHNFSTFFLCFSPCQLAILSFPISFYNLSFYHLCVLLYLFHSYYLIDSTSYFSLAFLLLFALDTITSVMYLYESCYTLYACLLNLCKYHVVYYCQVFTRNFKNFGENLVMNLITTYQMFSTESFCLNYSSP